MTVSNRFEGSWARLAAVFATAALLLTLVPTLAGTASAHHAYDWNETERLRMEEARNRFGTAVDIAMRAFPDGADTVVLARAELFADALAGSLAAGTLDAPILLTTGSSLHPVTAAAIDALFEGRDDTSVVLLGGSAAISANTETEVLARDSVDSVVRIEGKNRFDTARNIAHFAATHGLPENAPVDNVGTTQTEDDTTPQRTAIVATGEAFADALAAGPLAYGGTYPLLLTASDTLSGETEDALTDLDIDRVWIAGGPNAVSEATEDAVEALGIETIRVNVPGGDRTHTAVEFAELTRQVLYDNDAGDRHLAVATGFEGNGGVDALALAPLAARFQADLVITRGVTFAPGSAVDGVVQPLAFITEHCEYFGWEETPILLAGGPEAIAPSAEEQIKDAAICPETDPVDVTILHDTHFHGSFGSEDGPNIARYMALVEARKAANPDALFLGNGDDLAPSVLASVFHGEHMVEALNASPLDVNTFGNHEFDFGPDNLRERIAESEFQWVTANVRDIDTGEPFAADLGVERFTIVDVEGVSVGITGLGPEGMATVTTLGEETEQIPAIDAMTEVVPEMEAAGADIIVVTSHLCGPDARDLAAAVDGIDAIVGDHCAEVLEEPEVINDTIVSFAGDEFDFLGELTLTFHRGEILSHSFTLHEVTADITPDPTIQEIVDRWEAELDEALGEVIGERTNEWDVVQENVRSGETGIANYIVDAMRESVGADVAITNAGGLRSDQVYPAGDIILRDVQAILPFGNKVVMVEVTGATIREALEHGVAVGVPAGRFPQVSGMSYVWNPDAPSGARIVSVMVDGAPLDPTATYTLATNDFMLGGGDGYEMFAEGEVIIGSDEGQPMMDVVVDRIRAEGTVTVETDGRITQAP